MENSGLKLIRKFQKFAKVTNLTKEIGEYVLYSVPTYHTIRVQTVEHIITYSNKKDNKFKVTDVAPNPYPPYNMIKWLIK